MQLFKHRLPWVCIVIAAIYVTLHFTDKTYHILPGSSHIKQLTWSIFLISGTILLYLYTSRRPHPPGRHPGAEDTEMTVNKKIKVLDYAGNRIGDIDKMLFDDEGTPGWIHFPPHTAKYVMKTAPKNEMPEVLYRVPGHKAIDDKPIYELVAVHAITGDFTPDDVPPPPPEDGKPIELTGKIQEYRKDERGQVAAFVLQGYIVEIPKHMQQDIISILQSASEISVKGYERNQNDGFVNTSGFSLVRPYAFTINKTHYLL